jgi:heme-degrading monooxygenase HmoA
MTISPAVSRASDSVAMSAFDGSRLRVVLMLDIRHGAQQEFLEAYEQMCHHVASVPGHISDQLCQSLENPTQWLITSEWESAPPFLAWANSEEHLETVKPLQSCVRNTRSMRYTVLRETIGGGVNDREAKGQLQVTPRIGDDVVRHALIYTVKPGSESRVAEILADHASPETRVDDTTRLRRTSLFMHGNRVVRAVEVQGDLTTALRHVVRQPEVRAAEEALTPCLEQHHDLSDPQSARLFFTRAALPAVHHVERGPREGSQSRRHALFHPAKPGAGLKLARLLSRQDAAVVAGPTDPFLAATVFQRDDIVVRLIDVDGDPDDLPGLLLALYGSAGVTEAGQLLDAAALGVEGPLSDERTLRRLLAQAWMQPVTDRAAPTS